jgi:predicted HicB family RNase H-like nuclease
MLCSSPTLRREVYISALREDKSLNQWIAENLDRDC